MEKHDSNGGHGKKGNVLLDFYEKNYKPLLIVSVLILLFSFGVIIHQVATTGDFVKKGVSLTGGISITLQAQDASLSADDLQARLISELPRSDVSVRTFGSTDSIKYHIEASGAEENLLYEALAKQIPGLTFEEFNKNKQTIGPTFGESFFTQTLKAVFIAFLFMSIIIFLYFGTSLKYKWISAVLTIIGAFIMFYAQSTIAYIISFIIFFALMTIYIIDSVPSFGIVLCAFSDLFFALAIFNLSGHTLSIGGVAAFLMLVGYSIDTDILLSVRVLKSREGTVFDRVIDAFKTGITMSLCALIAAVVAYIFTHSIVIKEIMFVLIAGLIGDIIFTWVQNVGILRWHLEKKGWK
ncbi:MAG TPA: hypothetical protein VEC16_00950 [Alphaproteobacteria bacterium]|nr:hypothetical protein [Alphaproteobacteria bacterium]